MMIEFINKLFGRKARKVLTVTPHFKRRKMTMFHDVVFPYRMGNGFAGDVNRVHPASIEPCLIDASAPPTFFGEAVLIDPTTSGARPFAAGDTAVTLLYGFTVRPYPFQAATASQNFGGAPFGGEGPLSPGIVDVCRIGYILCKVNGAAVKDGAVYVWCAASSGAHVQGQLEVGASGGNTAAITNAKFNGTPDANGIVEVAVWMAT